MAQRRVLVVDIETVPNESLFGFVEKARGYGKGGVARDQQMLKSMSLDPLYGRVALAGMIVSSGGEAEDVSSGVLAAQDDAEEADVVAGYTSALRQDDLVVTFNGNRFDIPYLEMRARVLGVPLPRMVSTYPYGNPVKNGHVDLLNEVTNGGSTSGRNGPPHDLGSVAEVLGVPDQGPDMDGSQVYPTWLRKDFAKLKEYCLNDVILTAELFDRLYSQELGGRAFASIRKLSSPK